MKYSVICVAAALAGASGAASAEPAKISGTITDVFGHHFVVETDAGRLLVDVGPRGADKFTVKSGEKIEIEGNRDMNELHARRVTLANGHAYEVGKRGQSWTEWLTGKRAEPAGPFGGDQARKIASDKGYQVTGEPVATKRHFQVMAAKDGKSYELDVHRDGNIVERPAFGVAEAKKLAADKGYQLTAEPEATKKHFRVTATNKAGKPVEIDVHRDGNIVERPVFGAAEAKKLVVDKGYEPVGELQAVDEHFEMLGKKNGKFFELRAHRDGKVRDRQVDASDPRWGSLIR